MEDIERIASIAETELEKEAANDPEIKKIIRIVKKFIQTHRVLCYGGTAINNILQKKDQFYNFDLEIPDYDFYSETPQDHAKKLSDILAKAGISDVESKPGIHLGTFKVFAKYTGVADISNLDVPIFAKLWKESIVKDDIHYVPPNFLRMSIYLELSRPRGDVSRWSKVYKRLMLLNAEYPLDECSKDDINYHDEKLEHLSQIEHLIKNEAILLGYNAVHIQENKHEWVLPIDLLAEPKDALHLANRISHLFKNSKVHGYTEYAELLPPHYDVVDGKRLLVRIFETDACHSYHELESGLKVASIPTILNFLFAMMYADRHFTEKTTHQRLICTCQKLVELANNSKKRRFKLLTPLTCIGQQKGLIDMKKEKTELYEKLSKDRTSEDFLRYFFSYKPKMAKRP
jgi:hypothetical protein